MKLVLGCLLGSFLAAGCGDNSGEVLSDASPPIDTANPFDAGAAVDAGADVLTPTDGPPAPDAGVPTPTPFSVVVLPDTQFYSSSWPAIFDAQTRWIVDNKAAAGIAFVLHLGDIVDGDEPRQWMVADHALSMLDGNLPYVLAAGNHDYSNLVDRMGMANQYFPVSRMAQSPTFGGTFEADHIENSYSLIPAGGGRWLVLSLEFGPRDQVVAWAAGILERFADVPAIIITHAYLYFDGTRYDHTGPPQAFTPHGYITMGQPGSSINDGEELYRKLIAPHSNVKFVLSGHMVGNGFSLGFAASRLTSTRPDGSRVHQILSNYQYCLGGACPEVHGGDGYLRIMRFQPDTGTVQVQTYSPTLGQSLTDPQNQFELELR